MITLENEALRVRIDPLGAELKEITDKRHACPLLWEGGEAWKGSAPWLFPIVGRLKDDAFTFCGQRYALAKHGFARKSRFAEEALSPAATRFTLRDTPKTRACYPWPFTLQIEYVLTGDQLRIACAVENPSDGELLFSLGAHPGFVCAPGDALCFEREEHAEVYRLDTETHLLQPRPERVFTGRELLLTPELFDLDAMILRAPASRSATLLRRTGIGVQISFGEVPYLGLWSRPGSGLPYLCVEPWHGVDDPLTGESDLSQKPGIRRLPAGARFTMELTIRPLRGDGA